MSWEEEAQRAAEKRLDALDEWMDEVDGEVFEEPYKDWSQVAVAPPDVDPPVTAPYCGCRTCQVRETLLAAYPLMKAAADRGEL